MPNARRARGGLDRDRIVSTALRIARRRGFEQATMSGVARELGVTPMALYRHVGDVESLRHLVVEEILATIELPPHGSGPWREQFLAVLRKMHESYAECPGLAEYVLTVGPIYPSVGGVRIAEWFLQHFANAGLSSDQAGLAYATLRESFLAAVVRRPRTRGPVPSSPIRSAELTETLRRMSSVTSTDRVEFAAEMFFTWLDAQARTTGRRRQTNIG